jgi:predicted ATPase
VETLFVSRAGADAAISERVAAVLERAGFDVILQQRSFANKSFIQSMQSALESGARVVALLSPSYLASDYCAAEWQSVLADDPLNKRSRLIVLRVVECAPAGLLKALAYWDLVSVTEPELFENIVLEAVRVRQPGLHSNGAAPVAAAVAPVASTNLPSQFTEFIGRAQVVAEIKARIVEARLVTLLGAGGIGKTRTAVQVANDLHDGAGDGVWFVDLAPLGSAAYVVPELASVFAVREEHGKALLESVLAFLSAKRLLLIFDNCEHVVAEIRTVADAILRGCPEVRLIATTREALGVAGEAVYRLPTLGVPPSGGSLSAEEALRYESVALFAARARAADERFSVTDANAATVGEICRRLDGIALAIELAAPRVKILSVAQLATKLGERFRLLTGGSKTALPRQQTLRALIDWSYDLLGADEQRLFRGLAIFSGGWTLEAATAVCGGEDEDEFTILDSLTSLADKSLVVVDFSEEAQRFRLLESTRAYALERMRAMSEFDSLARRRSSYFTAFVVGDGATVGAQALARLAAIEPELENIREVLTWALVERHDYEGGARLAFALSRFWSMQLPREGQRWLELAQNELSPDTDPVLAAKIASAIAAMLPHGSFERFEATERALAASRAAGDPETLVRALSAYGEQLGPTGRQDEAQSAFEEALAKARACGSEWDAARALAGLGLLAVQRDDIEAARDVNHQAMVLFEALGAIDGVAYVCITLGQAEFEAGNVERAVDLMQRAREAHGRLNNNRSSACAANLLAAFALEGGRPGEARVHARDSLKLLENDRHPLFLTEAIAELAAVSTLGGDAERGALMYGYAQTVLATLAHEPSEVAKRCIERHLALLTQTLGASELAQRAAKGALLSQDAAFAEALSV